MLLLSGSLQLNKTPLKQLKCYTRISGNSAATKFVKRYTIISNSAGQITREALSLTSYLGELIVLGSVCQCIILTAQVLKYICITSFSSSEVW